MSKQKSGLQIYRELSSLYDIRDMCLERLKFLDTETDVVAINHYENLLDGTFKEIENLSELMYTLTRSDYEQRQLELYEEINLWKKKYKNLKKYTNALYADTDSVEPE